MVNSLFNIEMIQLFNISDGMLTTTTCDGSRFEGEITAFNKKSRQHRVRYTDGREEWSDLVTCGRFLSDDADGDAVVSAS